MMPCTDIWIIAYWDNLVLVDGVEDESGDLWADVGIEFGW
jgi:hypothetical protein